MARKSALKAVTAEADRFAVNVLPIIREVQGPHPAPWDPFDFASRIDFKFLGFKPPPLPGLRQRCALPPMKQWLRRVIYSRH